MKTGITPNALTVMGALVNGGVGVLAATGNLTLAGIVLLVSGLFDALDGALARRIGITSKFGAFLDSTLDRYSEAFVLGGVLVYAQRRGLALEELLAYVTLAGSLLISYTRARAESLGIDCKVGLLTRMERFLILSGLLIVQQLTIGLLILAILTHVTVIQRVLHVWRTLRRIERAEKE
jgi:CDP-diacylglycerol--glycerol-3-phosphate 3-phosphatidyltransferase